MPLHWSTLLSLLPTSLRLQGQHVLPDKHRSSLLCFSTHPSQRPPDQSFKQRIHFQTEGETGLLAGRLVPIQLEFSIFVQLKTKNFESHGAQTWSSQEGAKGETQLRR